MATKTLTLTDFLLARIAEDEAVARLAADTEGAEKWATLPPGELPNVDAHMGTLPHIARHDPARVLAECEAKRRIVELHDVDCYVGTGPDGDDEYFCEGCRTSTIDPADIQCPTLRALTLSYADHPDYRDEWRA